MIQNGRSNGGMVDHAAGYWLAQGVGGAHGGRDATDRRTGSQLSLRAPRPK